MISGLVCPGCCGRNGGIGLPYGGPRWGGQIKTYTNTYDTVRDRRSLLKVAKYNIL